MRLSILALSICLILTACGREATQPVASDSVETANPDSAAAPETSNMNYPEARRGDRVDDYFGAGVADPYRWMEDLDGDELKTWVDAQNALSGPYLENLPEREALRARLTELWNYERHSPEFKTAGRYFFERNDGVQNQSVLYVIGAAGGEPTVAIDPNGFSDDGTIALVRYSVSPDGRLIAYATSDGGSDWTTLHVRDLETGKDLPDTLTDTKFSDAAWTADSKGFYYGRYPRDETGRRTIRNRPESTTTVWATPRARTFCSTR